MKRVPTDHLKVNDGCVGHSRVISLFVHGRGNDVVVSLRHNQRTEVHAVGFDQDGQPLPEPSAHSAVDDDQSTVVLVDVDLLEYRKETDTKAVRKNVSMPAWLSYMANKHGVNCSQLLQDALKKELHIA